ncbi:MAG TPA: AMP-binding protein [Candidatus Nanopelagicales bacterium]
MSSSQTHAYRAARDLLLELRSDYDGAMDRFAWPSFDETFNWATDWFDAIARDVEATALWIVEEDGTELRRSFAEMAARSDQVAAWLSRLGVQQGDNVLLMLDNQVELWECMLALMKLGAVIMPTTTALGSSDLVDRVNRGGARHVIANVGDTAKFDAVPGDYTRISIGAGAPGWHDFAESDAQDASGLVTAKTSPSDPLLLYFTSGTTSKPKLVRHTQVSYPVGHLSTMYWLGLQPGDVHLNISSPGWAKHAWSCFFAPWIAEATIFIYNYKRFDAERLLEQIRRAQVTTFCAPPTVWRMLINADLAGGPGSLREAVGAGEPLNPEVIAQVQRQWGLTIRDGYGQTETTAQVGNSPGGVVKPGSMGRPLPGIPVVLLDPVTEEVSNEGEICLDLTGHPLALMTGYQGDPDRDATAMAGGFYHTGDVASRDDNGFITYVGRTDDVFKSSDYKVSPFEVESVLIEHPAVMEAAVVPAPDPVRLATTKAYIGLAPGFSPDRETALSILRYGREHLAPYLRVRRVEFYELPKTISGKIRRVELREREVGAAAGEVNLQEWREDQFPELADASRARPVSEQGQD